MPRRIAIADLHIGIDNVGGLNENGLPARIDDFLLNLQHVCDVAVAEHVDLLAVIGDLFKSRNPPQRVLKPVLGMLLRVAEEGIRVFLVRGNHDGDSEPGRPNVLDTAALLHRNICSFNEPGCLTYPDLGLNILAVPWPRLKWALGSRDFYGGAGDDYASMLEAANWGLLQRMAQLMNGRDPALPTLLLGHLAVRGADRSSEQWMTLGWEPTISTWDIPREVSLALFGHYHKGCEMTDATPDGSVRAAYCGSIAKIDFGEEGQDKFWWEFEFGGPSGKEVRLEPHLLPDRPFRTLDFVVHESLPPEEVNAAFAAYVWGLDTDLDQAVVRCRLDFGTAQQAAAFDENGAEALLRQAQAWWIAGIEIKAPRAARRADGGEALSAMPDPVLLMRYLDGQGLEQAWRQRLWAAGVGVMEGRSALDRGGNE